MLEKKENFIFILKKAKGDYSFNEYLDKCSLNTPEFRENLNKRSDAFKITYLDIQKIVTNADIEINKVKLKQDLLALANISESTDIYRGQIYWVDFGTNNIGSEQSNIRPALMVQNNIGNKYSPTAVVVAISTKLNKGKNMPTHVLVEKIINTGLNEDSVVLTEQVRTIDKSRIYGYIGECPFYLMKNISKAIKIEFDIYNPVNIADFVEDFANKFSLHGKFKIALAKEMQKYFETNNVDYMENVNNYITNLRAKSIVEGLAKFNNVTNNVAVATV